MRLSNPVKIFHTACFFCLFFTGCGLWRGNQNSAVTFASPSASEYPFTTREPDVFQTELVVRVGENERRMFIARDREKRRIDYDVGTDDHRAVLVTDKESLVYFKRRVYRETPIAAASALKFEPLTAHLLNKRDYAAFDEVGRDGSVVQFRAKINQSDASDVLIFFDESIGLPVRQEFYSIDGGQRTLQYSVELRGFRAEAGADLFLVPKTFRKESAGRDK